jgi:hypothetical protein
LSDAEPSDEMLRLIADLKAERDELKRDIDGWRTHISDLEKKSGALALRVDTERREAWIARERLGLLEVESALLFVPQRKATPLRKGYEMSSRLAGRICKLCAKRRSLAKR